MQGNSNININNKILYYTNKPMAVVSTKKVANINPKIKRTKDNLKLKNNNVRNESENIKFNNNFKINNNILKNNFNNSQKVISKSNIYKNKEKEDVEPNEKEIKVNNEVKEYDLGGLQKRLIIRSLERFKKTINNCNKHLKEIRTDTIEKAGVDPNEPVEFSISGGKATWGDVLNYFEKIFEELSEELETFSLQAKDISEKDLETLNIVHNNLKRFDEFLDKIIHEFLFKIMRYITDKINNRSYGLRFIFVPAEDVKLKKQLKEYATSRIHDNISHFNYIKEYIGIMFGIINETNIKILNNGIKDYKQSTANINFKMNNNFINSQEVSKNSNINENKAIFKTTEEEKIINEISKKLKVFKRKIDYYKGNLTRIRDLTIVKGGLNPKTDVNYYIDGKKATWGDFLNYFENIFMELSTEVESLSLRGKNISEKDLKIFNKVNENLDRFDEFIEEIDYDFLRIECDLENKVRDLIEKNIRSLLPSEFSPYIADIIRDYFMFFKRFDDTKEALKKIVEIIKETKKLKIYSDFSNNSQKVNKNANIKENKAIIKIEEKEKRINEINKRLEKIKTTIEYFQEKIKEPDVSFLKESVKDYSDLGETTLGAVFCDAKNDLEELCGILKSFSSYEDNFSEKNYDKLNQIIENFTLSDGYISLVEKELNSIYYEYIEVFLKVRQSFYQYNENIQKYFIQILKDNIGKSEYLIKHFNNIKINTKKILEKIQSSGIKYDEPIHSKSNSSESLKLNNKILKSNIKINSRKYVDSKNNVVENFNFKSNNVNNSFLNKNANIKFKVNNNIFNLNSKKNVGLKSKSEYIKVKNNNNILKNNFNNSQKIISKSEYITKPQKVVRSNINFKIRDNFNKQKIFIKNTSSNNKPEENFNKNLFKNSSLRNNVFNSNLNSNKQPNIVKTNNLYNKINNNSEIKKLIYNSNLRNKVVESKSEKIKPKINNNILKNNFNNSQKIISKSEYITKPQKVIRSNINSKVRDNFNKQKNFIKNTSSNNKPEENFNKNLFKNSSLRNNVFNSNLNSNKQPNIVKTNNSYNKINYTPITRSQKNVRTKKEENVESNISDYKKVRGEKEQGYTGYKDMVRDFSGRILLAFKMTKNLCDQYGFNDSFLNSIKKKV